MWNDTYYIFILKSYKIIINLRYAAITIKYFKLYSVLLVRKSFSFDNYVETLLTLLKQKINLYVVFMNIT